MYRHRFPAYTSTTYNHAVIVPLFQLDDLLCKAGQLTARKTFNAQYGHQFSTHPVFILLSLAFNFRATFRSPYITWDYLKNLDWKRPKKPKTNQKKLDLDTTEFKFILKEIFSTSNFSISQFFNFSISKHCYIFDITFTSILFDIFNINKTLPC